MAKASKLTQAKRNRERARDEHHRNKEEKKAARDEQRKDRERQIAAGIDPDLEGIVPGPQAPLEG
ncbi:MAG: hypothetical protein RJB38_888 [Pseudomonadota bacterium]